VSDPQVPEREPDSGYIEVELPEAPDAAPEPDDGPGESPAEPPAASGDIDVWVWGRWRYTGPPGRVYTIVPVTPQPGDVVETWGPLDGCWEPTDAEPTRMPDNWRPDLTDEEHARLRGDTN